jgi:hypothetical protein
MNDFDLEETERKINALPWEDVVAAARQESDYTPEPLPFDHLLKEAEISQENKDIALLTQIEDSFKSAALSGDPKAALTICKIVAERQKVIVIARENAERAVGTIAFDGEKLRRDTDAIVFLSKYHDEILQWIKERELKTLST